MKKYTIAPLRWEIWDDGTHRGEIADTMFGEYFIEDRKKGVFYWGYSGQISGWSDAEFRCKSIADGKKQARKDWVKRLSGALIEVE